VIKIPSPGVNMTVRDRGDHFEVTLLIVAEEKRGGGLGTRAILALQILGRAIRLTAIPHTYKKTALHRFYRRLGFQAVGKDVAGNTKFEWLPQTGGAK